MKKVDDLRPVNKQTAVVLSTSWETSSIKDNDYSPRVHDALEQYNCSKCKFFNEHNSNKQKNNNNKHSTQGSITFNGINYTSTRLREMSTVELTDLLKDINLRILPIAQKLKKARGDYQNHGKSANWKWYKNEKEKLTNMETLRQMASFERKKQLGNEQKNNENQKPLPFYFMKAAELLLSEDIFEQIKIQARTLKSKGEQNENRSISM